MRKANGTMDNKLLIAILKVRKKIYEEYQKNSRILDWVMKGLAGVLLFLSLNNLYGHTGGVMTAAAVVLAVICAVIPMRWIYPMAALLSAIHLWQISWDLALVYLAAVMLSYLLICRYQPDTAVIIAFAPLLFTMKLAFLLPILVGIFSSFLGMGAMVFGVLFYYTGVYSQNVAVLLSSANAGENVLASQSLLNFLVADSTLWLLLAAVVVAAIVTYVLYHQSFEYAWYIGITAGGLGGLVAYLVGTLVFDVETGNMVYLFMIPAAIVLAVGVQFFRCIIDYTGTEYVEFEDDEYYYYVKAVPKVKEIVEDFTALGVKKDKSEEETEQTEA